MDTLYMILTIFSAVCWLGLMLYCLPGAHRVVFGRPRRYDLLATVFAALSFNRLGYGITRLGFWEPEKLSSAEMAVRIIMTLFALLCALMALAVLRHYRRHEDMLR